MLDDEIQYFGDEENFDHDDDQEIPAESWTRNGKKVRGNDREWKMKRSFQNPADFEASNLLNEIKSEFTCQRRKEFDYNTVHTYTCKMSRWVGYEKCPKEIKIIFPSDSLSVVVQETGVHHHIEKSDIAILLGTSLSFQVVPASYKNNWARSSEQIDSNSNFE